MTSTQQRAALQRQIWQIANDVRGAVDGWDFKQYVLGTLFYRFISENFASYIEAGDDSINYAELPDSVITPDIKDDAIKTKGYFIYPSQLFVNIAASANTNESLNTDLATIFASIESSASGYRRSRTLKACLPISTPPATASVTPWSTRTPAWPQCSKAWPGWNLVILKVATSTCLAMPTSF
jgi:type I restriction enzyme M protein